MIWDLNPTGPNCLSSTDILGTTFKRRRVEGMIGGRTRPDMWVTESTESSSFSVATWLYIVLHHRTQAMSSPRTERQNPYISVCICLESLETKSKNHITHSHCSPHLHLSLPTTWQPMELIPRG